MKKLIVGILIILTLSAVAVYAWDDTDPRPKGIKAAWDDPDPRPKVILQV